MTEIADLKPCPFCGGNKLHAFDNAVHCEECDASGPDLGHCVGIKCRHEAMSVWNTRPLDAKDKRIAELEAALYLAKNDRANLADNVDRLEADLEAGGWQPPDDGTCVRCSAAPRNASGLCATCVDEDAERAGEVQSQALWRETLDAERVLQPCSGCDEAAEEIDSLSRQNAHLKIGLELAHETTATFERSALEAWHQFKNFHRLLCERMEYPHDEKYWYRDQVSLIEWIANRAEAKPLPTPPSCSLLNKEDENG